LFCYLKLGGNEVLEITNPESGSGTKITVQIPSLPLTASFFTVFIYLFLRFCSVAGCGDKTLAGRKIPAVGGKRNLAWTGLLC
jgi:hypothetical protein